MSQKQSHTHVFGGPTLETFLRRWDPYLVAATRRGTSGCRDLADDVAQETRIKLASIAGDARSRSAAFVHAVIRNALCTALARHRRQRDWKDEGSVLVTPDLAGTLEDIEVALRAQAVHEWVSGLPSPLCKIYQYLYERELSQREAATHLRVSQARVAQLHRKLLTRGRQQLAASVNC